MESTSSKEEDISKHFDKTELSASTEFTSNTVYSKHSNAVYEDFDELASEEYNPKPGTQFDPYGDLSQFEPSDDSKKYQSLKNEVRTLNKTVNVIELRINEIHFMLQQLCVRLDIKTD